LGISGVYAAEENNGLFDPFQYGAKGDGITLDTRAIQTAIEKCNAEGGGRVYLHNGCFISGTIYLKSNVTLEIENGAILKASNNLADFPNTISNYPSYTGEMITNKMLIYAEEVKNISICGRGIIDGNGDQWVEGPYETPSFSVRPRIIHFRACENIKISGVTLYNSASWVESYQSCSNLVIDGINVDSRANKDIERPRFEVARGRNCDGLDLIDCHNVRISNCNINSEDDGICLKSFSPNESCQNIVISNCIVSTNASGIKIGTETAGGIRDITINNCVVYDTRGDALAVMTVDGAKIERVNISNITLRNIKGTAIFIRLGKRMRYYRKDVKFNQPYLKDIMISNVIGSEIGAVYCCSVCGLSDASVENVKMKDIQLQFVGSGNLSDANLNISEKESSYPNGRMFGSLPSYGFYIRHAKNITLENIELSFLNEDQRPAIWCDDVDGLYIKALKAKAFIQTPELIRLKDIRESIISESYPMSFVKTFLSLYGDKNDHIILKDNILKKAKLNIRIGDNCDRSAITEIGTIK